MDGEVVARSNGPSNQFGFVASKCRQSGRDSQADFIRIEVILASGGQAPCLLTRIEDRGLTPPARQIKKFEGSRPRLSGKSSARRPRPFGVLGQGWSFPLGKGGDRHA